MKNLTSTEILYYQRIIENVDKIIKEKSEKDCSDCLRQNNCDYFSDDCLVNYMNK